jgi:nicotinate-nucleotide pyrophosphorylase (carboxylating)
VEEVLHYASQTKTSLTRIMLDNMVVPLPNGDVDISMLKEAVQLVNGRFETEVFMIEFLHLTYIVLLMSFVD